MKNLMAGIFAVVGAAQISAAVDLGPLVAGEESKVIAWRRDGRRHVDVYAKFKDWLDDRAVEIDMFKAH